MAPFRKNVVGLTASHYGDINAAFRFAYSVQPEIEARSFEKPRHFIRDWIERQHANRAFSIPPEIRYAAPPDGPRAQQLTEEEKAQAVRRLLADQPRY